MAAGCPPRAGLHSAAATAWAEGGPLPLTRHMGPSSLADPPCLCTRALLLPRLRLILLLLHVAVVQRGRPLHIQRRWAQQVQVTPCAQALCCIRESPTPTMVACPLVALAPPSLTSPCSSSLPPRLLPPHSLACTHAARCFHDSASVAVLLILIARLQLVPETRLYLWSLRRAVRAPPPACHHAPA